MDQFALDVVWKIGTTSLFMAFSIAVAIFALRLLKCHSPSLQCFVWSACLIQGVLLTPFVVDSPAKTPDFPLQLLTVPQQAPATLAVAANVANSKENASTSSANSTSQPIALRREDWAVLILGLWLGGIAFLVGRWIASYATFVRRTDIQPCDQSDWNRELSEIKNSLSIREPIDLFVSDHIGPALCRYPRGYRVVVPQSTWNQFSSVQRQSILTHELAHFKRKDIWRNLIGQMIATLHWFNPLTWYALRQLELASEFACDDIAASKNRDNITSYASALLEIGSQSASPLPLASSAAQSSIALRIRHLVAASIVRDSIWKRAAVVVMLLPLILVQLVRFEVKAQEPIASTTGEEKAKVLKVSDTDFNNAAEYLRGLGVFVRTFHERTSKDHWIQIHLKDISVDEKVMSAVAKLTLDARTELTIRDDMIREFFAGGSRNATPTTMSADALTTLRDTQITDLTLSGEFVTDEHVEALANWQNLTSLSLGGPKLTSNALKQVAKLQHIKSLSLGHNFSFQGSDLVQTGLGQTLDSLSFLGPQTADKLEVLTHATRLRSLRVGFTDEDASNLLAKSPCLSSLEQLYVSGNRINEPLLTALSTNAKQLSSLYMSHVKNLTPQAITSVMSMNQLTHLSFSECNVSDEDIKSIDTFQRLKWLDLSACSITDNSLPAIGKLKSLQYLLLRQTKITNEGVSHLIPLTNLRNLDMRSTQVNAIPEEFRKRERISIETGTF